jgi:hypothetical protein
MKLLHKSTQVPQALVRAYANWLKSNWRWAGSNQQMNEEVLNNIAAHGLHNALKNYGSPRTPVYGRFDTFNEFFDKATASEVECVQNKKPQQSQKQQHQQKQPTDMCFKSCTRETRPLISTNTNSSGVELSVHVQVGIKLFPTMQSGSSIHPDGKLRYTFDGTVPTLLN